MIYLDNAATTPLDPAVREAMLPLLDPLGALYANPSSAHVAGQAAAHVVTQARAQVAQLVGAQDDEIIFTSGATESNNLAIKGALEFYGGRGTQHVITSKTEHRCVLDTCRYLETRDVRVTYLKPGHGGVVSAQQVLDALTPDTRLVSLMWVNNEIGTINQIEALAPQLRGRGVMLHVDAVQAAGKIPVDMAQVPVDLLSFTAHKLHGPKGIGALYVRKRPRARLAPQLHGSGHEQGMRSGTLATHQIAGFGAACEVARVKLAEDGRRLGALRDELWLRLSALPRAVRNGDPAASAPHILNVSFDGAEGESLRALLPELAVSSGSACSSATREPSFVLRALGHDDELAGSSLRFSLGRMTSAADIAAAADMVVAAVTRLRALNPRWSAA
ncbi:MAG TPA: aminotransferase class V-fold PLP-dependent enzyme [Nevskiaceae bacterium]|nr:aminotransferase class V-fold PLP-dependent enzyme [Nevskiaceae bacterium]